MQGASRGRAAIWALLASVYLSSAVLGGELDISTSISQQCTPLNVTWVPQRDAYPYTVWIGGLLTSVETFRVDSNYQPNAEQLTFQYSVPAQSSTFNNFVVTVADSLGNGNTTRPLNVATPSGSSSSCDPFTAQSSWVWAGDSQVGGINNMVQCGTVRFYNIDRRGTRPFTISWVPVNGTPITVNVPQSATSDISTFIYNSTVPFAEGTQFQIVLGDASGGASGGGSQLYTVGPSSDRSCLAPNFVLPNSNTRLAIPVSNNIATFQNLAGAISADASNGNNTGGGGGDGSGGGGTSVGAIAGGAIGGAIALGVMVGCGIAFLLYRRRQKKAKEDARKDDAHFVDLDGDEDENGAAGAAALTVGRGRRPDGGVPQSYSVSPFTYQPAPTHESPEFRNEGGPFTSHEMTNVSTGRPGSFAGQSSIHAGVAMPSSSHSRVSSGYASPLQHNPSWSYQGHSVVGHQLPQPPLPVNAAAFHGRQSSVSSAGVAYRLRATNQDEIDPAEETGGGSTGSGSSSMFGNYNSNSNDFANVDPAYLGANANAQAARADAGPLPRKGALPGDEETRPTANPNRRVVMHADGGPLPQPESDDEEAVDELPPQYGGWNNGPGDGGLNREPSTSRRQI
ncbi:hypothetical protein IE53DRAFT_96302 [Violaceomyces palustris]|uniref:Uncharacterized protein n=1 Tax=Violaceomyces palustris TaxID=1673888 RepID=A0ACD0P6V3_9BASI|nr:hypothetical protein IE53DRAFT_96302 [Violaceomyces palustris]